MAVTVVNRFDNPRAGLANTNWVFASSAGTGVPTRVATGGPTGIPTYLNRAADGSSYYEDILYESGELGRLDGTTYSFGVWVYTDAPVDTQVYPFIKFTYPTPGGGTAVNSFFAGASEPVTPNQWVYLTGVVDFAQIQVNATYDAVSEITFGARLDRFSAPIPAATRFSVTGASMVENINPLAPYSGEYFDGSTTPAGPASYAWQGAAHASESVMTIQIVEPLTGVSVATLTILGKS